MKLAAPSPAPEPEVRRASFWRRRVVNPLLALLTQGVTPDKLAATLAVGTVCSLFPFLGTTAALNLGVGLWLRMNQPVLQTLNQLLGPLHLIMILIYVRAGESLWRAPETERFSIVEMVRAFADLSLGEFLQSFGWAGIYALTAWAITAPVLLGVLYLILRPVLRRLATRKVAANSPDASAASGS